MSSGILSQISFAMESAWGDAATPSKSIAIKAGDGIKSDIDLQLLNGIRGVMAKNLAAHEGNHKYEGDFEMDLTPGYIGYLLKSLFGGVTSGVKSGETVVYEHTFAEAESKPSMTVEQAIGEIVKRYPGTIAVSMKFSVKNGEAAKIVFGVKSKSVASATKVVGVYETSVRAFDFADILTANGVKLGGTAYDEVSSIEVEYSTGIVYKHALGSHDPAYYSLGGSEVKTKIEMYMTSDSAAQHTNYLNKTEQSFQLTLTGDSIGTSSFNQFDISVPVMALKAASLPISEDQNLVTIEGEGIYDKTTGKLISAVLTNLTSSYS